MTVKESLCCQEIPAIQDKLVDNAQEEYLQCITKNPRFYWICMDCEELETAMLSMADMRADSLVAPMDARWVKTVLVISRTKYYSRTFYLQHTNNMPQYQASVHTNWLITNISSLKMDIT